MPSCSQQLCVETTASSSTSATSATVALSLAVAATVPPAIGSIATEKASTKTIIVRIPTADLPLRPKVSCEVGHGSSQSSASHERPLTVACFSSDSAPPPRPAPMPRWRWPARSSARAQTRSLSCCFEPFWDNVCRSHDICRRETAFLLAGFNLNCRMMNAEAMVQLVRGFHQERIIDPAVRANKMDRERRLGRAHWPNVKVMHFADAGQV